MESTVAHLISLSDYRSNGRSAVFPSAYSLDWFIRKHKQILLDRGAIISPTGRKLINPTEFDQLVLEIGAESAKQLNR